MATEEAADCTVQGESADCAIQGDSYFQKSTQILSKTVVSSKEQRGAGPSNQEHPSLLLGVEEKLMEETHTREKDTLVLEELAKIHVTRHLDGSYIKILAGIPIYNYHNAHKNWVKPSLMEQKEAVFTWTTMLPTNHTYEQEATLCNKYPM